MPVFWQSDLSKLLVSKFEHPKEWKRPAKVCHEHRSSDLPLLRSIEDDLAGAHWVLRVLSNVLIVSRPVLVVAEPVRGILSEGLRLLRLPQDAGCGSEHSRASACRNADLPSRLPSPSAKSLLNHPRSRGLQLAPPKQPWSTFRSFGTLGHLLPVGVVYPIEKNNRKSRALLSRIAFHTSQQQHRLPNYFRHHPSIDPSSIRPSFHPCVHHPFHCLQDAKLVTA